MFDFFRRNNSHADPSIARSHQGLVLYFNATGIRYPSPADTSTESWLAMPFTFPPTADLGARLAQLHAAGYGEKRPQEFFLSWRDIYRLLGDPDWSSYRQGLGIPENATARPHLASRGALMDEQFTILLDGWHDPQGRPLQPAPQLQGRVLQTADTAYLLPEPLHHLLEALEQFHATPAAERNQTFKEQIFGRMRRYAQACGCPVSDYIARTIVLTPEKLRLDMAQRGEGDGKVVEVIPGFDEAPAHWLHQFDRLPLQDRYDVPDGPALVRVVLSPEVKTVLAEIKAMPGRRASGPRAQAFVRNPFAVLGEVAAEVVDTHQFENAREQAGIRFEQFRPIVDRGHAGEVLRVGLQVEALATDDDPADAIANTEAAQTHWFQHIQELHHFTTRLALSLADGSQCISWRRHELEILGDTASHLSDLLQWANEWASPQLWTAAEVLDLSQYSDRVEDIGVEAPFLTPVVVRHDDSGDWFPENLCPGLRLANPDNPSQPQYIPVTFAQIPTLQQAVRAAELAGQDTVALPGVRQPVPIADARRAIDALDRLRYEPPPSPSGSGGGKTAAPPSRLIIKRNLEAVDYTEKRADHLFLPPGSQPQLPRALLPHVQLKEHQRTGVVWLQHLWNASPQHCRGTILADDMGLGKTLQLLTFMAHCFEADPTLPPALIVAPVALLENWRNELQRFFATGTLPLLLLYGSELQQLRVKRHEIDEQLRAQGVTRLLKKGWRGNAQLVLTTYETMRDLEFALASQDWSIMVCDEAQKIKTPAALVTRSAKKQKVRFRIACTGTPVENTLADLWCLFDFVQPGMLGALSQFSRTYRQPIEAKTPEQQEKLQELRSLIEPQLLHRKKTEVATDLLAPVEDALCKQLPMTGYQLGLYQQALDRLRQDMETGETMGQLQALQAIRKICSDPHGHADPNSLRLPIEKLVNESPKMGWLVQQLKTLAAATHEAHKVIVFCEFRELQLQLQRVVAAFFGIAASIVNGETSADPLAYQNRQQLIDAFQAKDGFNVIILSPLAVGFGVNIQAANHVIHFTRTWNPAKEDQATARAYRIGQKRTVHVYYPGVVHGDFMTFDVKLDHLLSGKRSLADDILNGCSDLRMTDFSEIV